MSSPVEMRTNRMQQTHTRSLFDWSQLDITIAGLQRHYQQGDFTPRQLVQHLLTLEQVDNHNIWIERLQLPQLERYLTALEQTSPDALPLYGVPFAVKDNIDLAGVDSTAACEAYRYQADASATVVAKLIAAGAMPMGKTNMDQFATGLVGVRSPWGAGKNAFNPDYISGGSSSGSAVATAKGLVSFALGTDTAGSGRVPAAFNNLIGLKPSRGVISCKGVIPACQSLDCVSIFALTVDDANLALAAAEGHDLADPYSRPNPFDNSARRYGALTDSKTIAIPLPEQLQFFGDDTAASLYQQAIAQLQALGHQITALDMTPFLDAARLLYEGPWVAERYVATEALFNQDPDAMLPVIQTIIGGGAKPTAADGFKAMYKLQACRQQAEQVMAKVDFLLLPTTPTCFTIAAVEADPIKLNSQLGTYTNFVNLLDMAAIAIPVGFLPMGVGFGVTLLGKAFSDRQLLSLANQFCQHSQQTIGALDKPLPASSVTSPAGKGVVDLVVCGAHLSGMPLNWQLSERGAVKIAEGITSADYRLFAMADGRPAMVRDEQAGAGIAVETWRVPIEAFGSFVADIPAPLGIGKVQLEDGAWYTSFIAEPRAVEGATEITHLGGWRAYCAKG
ncbi:allophanate hydrolase [Corallincola luteus]|nr:allophanate hydrolase [Corallincola luteus]